MRNIQQKKSAPPIRTLYSRPVLILLLLAIIVLTKAAWGVYLKEQESRKNVAMVKVELEALEKRRAVLVVETDKLNTEEGVEEAIRRKFQVSRDGESVLVVVDKPLPAAAAEEKNGFFGKMWESVSGIFKDEE